MKIICRLATLVIIIVFIVHCSFGQTGTPKVDFASPDRYIMKSMKDWNIPGLAIAIVKDDSVAFAKGFGARTMDPSGLTLSLSITSRKPNVA